MKPMEVCRQRLADGTMRVDAEQGIVYQTFVTSLYTYERPIGVLRANGYVGISLGARRMVYAHRVVWLATAGEIDSDLVVNHINGVKHDNRISNLELVTSRENSIHAHQIGLVKTGEEHASRKLTAEQVEAARAMLATGASAKRIGARFDVSPALIHMIKGGHGRFAESV